MKSRKLDSYLVQNVSFMYTVNNRIFKDLTFHFLINNLFNEQYETNAWVYKYNSRRNSGILWMDTSLRQASTGCLKLG